MDGSQQTHLIDGVLSILAIHIGEFDLLDSIGLLVILLDSLVDSPIAPCAELLDKGEIRD